MEKITKRLKKSIREISKGAGLPKATFRYVPKNMRTGKLKLALV